MLFLVIVVVVVAVSTSKDSLLDWMAKTRLKKGDVKIETRTPSFENWQPHKNHRSKSSFVLMLNLCCYFVRSLSCCQKILTLQQFDHVNKYGFYSLAGTSKQDASVPSRRDLRMC